MQSILGYHIKYNNFPRHCSLCWSAAMCMSVQLVTGDPEKQQIPLNTILQYSSHCYHGKIKLADVTVFMVTTTKMLSWQHIPSWCHCCHGHHQWHILLVFVSFSSLSVFYQWHESLSYILFPFIVMCCCVAIGTYRPTWCHCNHDHHQWHFFVGVCQFFHLCQSFDSDMSFCNTISFYGNVLLCCHRNI